MNPSDFMALLTASPSPYHATVVAAELLGSAGFRVNDLGSTTFEPGAGLVRRGGLLIAWAPIGGRMPDAPRCRLIGAHTDSPNLRVKPRPDLEGSGLGRLAAEPYGGVLANSWLDRDLGLSGRVVVSTEGGTEERLFLVADPVARVPQLAIHLDRELVTDGLRLDPQRHLNLLWSMGDPIPGDFVEWLASRVDCPPTDVLSWDVMAHDVTPPTVWGRDDEFLSSARLDNLCSAFGAVTALRSVATDDGDGPSMAMVALFDHEEVGSTSATGAASGVVAGVIERVAAAAGTDLHAVPAMMARSSFLSADMAHAGHPNHPDRHEPSHPVRLGGGPVAKINVAQRYASDATSVGELASLCRSEGIPLQTYAHRADMACGSTIGPTVAAGLGVSTVDAGVAQLSMHSIRETMAVADLAHQHALMTAWLRG